MAALTQDRETIHSYTGAITREGVAGEAITPGSAVYLKAADGKYWTAANTSVEAADAIGIALTSSVADGPITIQTAGEIDLGATLASTTGYFLGAADDIQLEADVQAGEVITMLGVATTTSALTINIIASGVTA